MQELAKHQRVFGIGLSKTATTSLGQALNMLGIRTIHYPQDEQTYKELTGGMYQLSILEDYQGVVDTPVVPYYAQLDKVYPDSKFILTIREKASWLRSMQHHWEIMQDWWARDIQFRKFTQFICASVYGTLGFNEDRLIYVYETHIQNVREYFRGRPEHLLVMDICGGDGWEVLCSFLGCSIPDMPFPHLNSRTDKNIWQKWIHRHDRLAHLISTLVPPDETFILVDDSKLGSGATGGRSATPFFKRDGSYWGPPADDSTAIQELVRLRQSGASFIVFAWPAFWWLDYYAGLSRFLHERFRCVMSNDCLIAFDLRSAEE